MRKMLKEGGPPPQGRWGDLAVLEPVRDYKARHASTLLVFDAVEDAIRQIEAKRRRSGRMPTLARPAKACHPRLGSIYPAPFDEPLAGRAKRALGDALQPEAIRRQSRDACSRRVVLAAPLARERG